MGLNCRIARLHSKCISASSFLRRPVNRMRTFQNKAKTYCRLRMYSAFPIRFKFNACENRMSLGVYFIRINSYLLSGHFSIHVWSLPGNRVNISHISHIRRFIKHEQSNFGVLSDLFTISIILLRRCSKLSLYCLATSRNVRLAVLCLR